MSLTVNKSINLLVGGRLDVQELGQLGRLFSPSGRSSLFGRGHPDEDSGRVNSLGHDGHLRRLTRAVLQRLQQNRFDKFLKRVAGRFLTCPWETKRL